MRLLVLGGTGFLGGELVAAALSRGHAVTLLNRGETAPARFPDVEHVRADRDGDWELPSGAGWDASVDVWPFTPALVRGAARKLAGRVERLAFVSSVSVYSDLSRRGFDETAAVHGMPEGVDEECREHVHYGGLKARCEQALEAEAPGRSLVVRPGLIVGPGDPSDRFTYWPRRLAAGGEVAVAGAPDRRVQLIDVRDLAAFMVRLLEARATGTFHVSGPAEPLTMGEMLERTARAVGGEPRLTWVDGARLEAAGVTPWMGMPLYVPPGSQGMLEVDLGRALAAGLVTRPLEETARDTLEWDRSRGPEVERPCGPTPEQEARLLGATD